MDIFLGTLFIVICILLVIVVLLQRGRGGGLGAAFGGAGSSAFGTRTGDVFTWVTIVLTAMFLLLAIGANFIFRPDVEQVKRPRFEPPPSDYEGTVTVTLSCETPRAEIFYTTDGSEPTRASKKYAIAEKLDPPFTIRARAFRKGFKPSEIATASYTITQAVVETPTFDPPAKPLDEPTEVTIRCATDGATIRYTTDGQDPTAESPEATGPVTVSPGTTLKARAFREGYRPSEIASAEYSGSQPTTAPADD